MMSTPFCRWPSVFLFVARLGVIKSVVRAFPLINSSPGSVPAVHKQ